MKTIKEFLFVVPPLMLAGGWFAYMLVGLLQAVDWHLFLLLSMGIVVAIWAAVACSVLVQAASENRCPHCKGRSDEYLGGGRFGCGRCES